ncbi:MAG: hypothetical protein QG632_810 [Candidatus Dependentiae bacterium]|nr:hypothetical protein [Candidatus Dependentiae bacterium]
MRQVFHGTTRTRPRTDSNAESALIFALISSILTGNPSSAARFLLITNSRVEPSKITGNDAGFYDEKEFERLAQSQPRLCSEAQ